MKILILGGSGFIGRNLIYHFLRKKDTTLISIDRVELDLVHARLETHTIDLINYSIVEEIMLNYRPDLIINTAARCDIDGSKITDYGINYELPQNIIRTINSNDNFDPKILFFSTMLVYKVGFTDESNIDYNPDTAYGKSKLLMEQLIKNEAKIKWIIVRPTSIWGPGFTTYKNFFMSVKNKWFIKIRNSSPKKSYGFVLNIVHQIDLILSENTAIRKTYYLGDYEPMLINHWADIIADEWGVRRPVSLPRFVLYPISVFGTILSRFGIAFPLTKFRYNNMTTENSINLVETKKICPELPYSLEEGVKLTIEDLRKKL